MLRTHRGPQSKPTAKTGSYVLFSVGGRRLAVHVGEVGGVGPWPRTMRVPSQTPHVYAVARQDKQLIPVFDLAERLGVQIQGSAPLCLIIRQPDGLMAICVDEDVPSLTTIELSAIRPSQSSDCAVVGSFHQGDEEVPIYALDKLGLETGSEQRR